MRLPLKEKTNNFLRSREPSAEQLFQNPCNFLSRRTLSYAHNLNTFNLSTLFSHFSPAFPNAIIKQLYRKNSNGEDKHPR